MVEETSVEVVEAEYQEEEYSLMPVSLVGGDMGEVVEELGEGEGEACCPVLACSSTD